MNGFLRIVARNVSQSCVFLRVVLSHSWMFLGRIGECWRMIALH